MIVCMVATWNVVVRQLSRAIDLSIVMYLTSLQLFYAVSFYRMIEKGWLCETSI